ncbi:hypothetical protein [Aneurinibacillus aneurinilyticus]|jgi:hypothetical protein|uniref:hypothetical protein n=1 Tax=Aneurinibacillus aneurinilyticus TaxID=1391 RepID=UPI0023F38B21|nr:hypothetical protein [Aneurinibacillus aneurinilyticus]MCI1694503.1 hypothetical protein [Aneurinibacillus aneurinilyticus]
MKEVIIYMGAAMSISILLFILAFYALAGRKEGKSGVVSIGSQHFDVPLWQGKVKEVIHDDNVHMTEMDVIVYSKSIFMGFASQGFPFVNINAEDIIRVQYHRHSVSIEIKGMDGQSGYVKIKGAEEKALLQFARKVEFIANRAKKRSGG